MARWWHRAKVVFLGVPIVLMLMLVDALAAAFGELTIDWRDLCSCLREEWTIGAEEAMERNRASTRGEIR